MSVSEGGGAQPGPLVPPRTPTINNTAFPGLIVPPGGGGATGSSPYPSDNNNIMNGGPQIEPCNRIDTHYDINTATLFSLYIICGLLYAFLGYRCFKTTMFLTGFIFASSIVYLICLQGELMPSYGNAGVSLLAGVLFGLITMLVQYVGLFMSGLHTGTLLGLAALLIADHSMESASPKGSIWLCLGVLLGSALIFAICSLYFRKSLTILGTAVYGGAMVAASMDYFIERLSMGAWLWQRASLRPVQPPPCWFSWIVLAAWPAFALAGLIVQCALTGTGIYHEDVSAGRKKARGPSVRGLTRAERAEMRQKKYRYLYQVRTAHGDVISQNFVQAMQKPKDDSLDSYGRSSVECGSGGGGGGGECSTLQSDATHLTILPDAQLAALTESEDDSQTEIAPSNCGKRQIRR